MRGNSAIIVSLAIFILVANINCLPQQDSLLNIEEAKVEENDFELLCNDLNITVTFSGLSLQEIRENFLSSPLITCLDLSYNQISFISNNAFYNLPNLKYLNLIGNSFNLYNFFTNSFPNLEILILNDNDFGMYQYYDFENPITGIYTKLRKLYLKNNRMSSIRAISKTNFPMLTHLYLTGNPISDDEFSWLPETLEYFDLTGHHLTNLTLQNLKHLKWLFLNKYTDNDNKLNNIYLENLQSLLYLSIPSNNIYEITSSTFINVTSLKYLDLSDNSIRNIEADAFQSMQKLEFLNISNNKIEALHFGTLDRLKNLKTLILEKNFLSSIPMITEELNLEMLFLNCNNIKNIGRNVLVKLPYLKSLYLQDNEITQLNEEAFVGLEKLKILVLSNNKLSALPSNWLLPMISLEELDLKGNNIIKFGHLGLSKSSPMISLYLSNELRYIEPQSIFTMPENVTVILNDAPHFVTCKTEESEYARLNIYG